MDDNKPKSLEQAVRNLLLSWDTLHQTHGEGFASHINQVRQALALNHMKTYLHRWFLLQPNATPQEIEGARTLSDVLQHAPNFPINSTIEERIFEWTASRQYDRLGNPSK